MSDKPYNTKTIALGAIGSVSALILLILINPDGYMQDSNAAQVPPAVAAQTTSPQQTAAHSANTKSAIDIGGISSELKIQGNVVSIKETIPFEVIALDQNTKLTRNIRKKVTTLKGEEINLSVDQATIDIDNNAEFGELVDTLDMVAIRTSAQSRALFTGRHLGVVNYKLNNALSAIGSLQELHYYMFYNTDSDIQTCELIFTVPENLPVASVRSRFFVSDEGQKEMLLPKDAIEIKNDEGNSRIRYIVRRVFQPGQSLRVSLAWPKPNLFDFDNIPAKQKSPIDKPTSTTP